MLNNETNSLRWVITVSVTKHIRCLAVCGLLLSPLFSQTSLSDDRIPEQQKFVIKTGIYKIFSMSTELRVDQTGGAIGTSVGLEQTLNMPDSVEVQRLDGYYRINKDQRIEFSYYNINRSGSVDLPDPITIGDVTIPAGITTSNANSIILKGLWSYSFINDQDYEFGLGVGLHLTLNKTTVTSALGAKATEDITIPLPVISFRGAWHITRKLMFEAKQDIFLVDIGESRGTLVDFGVRLEHQTFKHVGFGGELSYLGSNMQTKSGGLNAQLQRRYRGAMIYMKGVF